MEHISAETVTFGVLVIGTLLLCLAACFVPFDAD